MPAARAAFIRAAKLRSPQRRGRRLDDLGENFRAPSAKSIFHASPETEFSPQSWRPASLAGHT
jgi:hypothetical protein